MNAISSTKSKELQSSASAWTRRREDEERVLRSLEELCDREKPGARIPTHTELMREFNASERAVLRSLAELKRRGRIVRRHGSGTYVGNSPGVHPIAPMGPDAASKTIVVIAKPDHGFFDDCVSQLYSHADSQDFEIVCQLLRSDYDALTELRPVLGSAAGYILFGAHLAPIAKLLLAAGNKVVVVGAPDIGESIGAPYVCNDHEAGGFLAVNHLIELGHRRIGFQFNYEREMRSHRWRGNRRALDNARRAGIAVSDTIFHFPQLEGWDADPAAARKDLIQPGAPTALVAWNDFTAVRLMNVLQRAQIRIPQDISVIGYDNASIAERSNPHLTTIDSGVGQLLNAAIRTLQNWNASDPLTTQMTIPHLVVRGTLASPRT